MGIQKMASLHILVHESGSYDQRLLIEMLETLGCSKVDIANSSGDIYESLALMHYDLAFLNFQDPEEEILEIARHINRRWSGKEKPALIVAGIKEGDCIQSKYIKAGVNDFLTDPPILEGLLKVLSRRI
jgi:CheY-like chemotaxis protein